MKIKITSLATLTVFAVMAFAVIPASAALNRNETARTAETAAVSPKVAPPVTPPPPPVHNTVVVSELEYAESTAATYERELPESATYFEGEIEAEQSAVEVIQYYGDTDDALLEIWTLQLYYDEYSYGTTGTQAQFFNGVYAGYEIAVIDLEALGLN